MKPKVLLVEDDPITGMFLHAATQMLDVEVDLAVTARQALALAAQTRHAAWLVDARLPDGGGEELLPRLRQMDPDVPALAHTASTDPRRLQQLRDAGFAVVVSKPLSAAAWQAAVHAVLAAAAPLLWDDAAGLRMLGGDASALGALRELFVQELAQQMGALECARAQGDDAAIHAELHRLSASCGFVGAARLAQAIRVWYGNSAALAEVLHAARDTLTAFSALLDPLPRRQGPQCAHQFP